MKRDKAILFKEFFTFYTTHYSLYSITARDKIVILFMITSSNSKFAHKSSQTFTSVIFFL